MLHRPWKRTIFFSAMVMLVGQLLSIRAYASDLGARPPPTVTEGWELTASDALEMSEIIDYRTANEKYFRMGDGIYTALLYPDPIHYQDSEGNWIDIHNKPVTGLYGNQYAYQIQIGNLVKSFASSTNGHFLFGIENDGNVLELALRGKGLGSPIGGGSTKRDQSQTANSISANGELNGYTSQLVYGNILNNAELTFYNTGFNTIASISVQKRQNDYSYSLDVSTSGLSVEQTKSGEIYLLDNLGKIVLKLKTPYSVDYAGAVSNAVGYSLEDVDGQTVLTVNADREWMDTASRVYPVTISCVFECSSDTQTGGAEITHLTQGSPTAFRAGEEELYFGYSCSDDVQESQIFFCIDSFPGLPDEAEIIDATVQLKQTSFSEVLCESAEIGLFPEAGHTAVLRGELSCATWNTAPNVTGDKTSIAVCSEASNGEYLRWNITDYARIWRQSSTPGLFNLKLESIQNFSKNHAMIITVEGGKARVSPLLLVHYSVSEPVKERENNKILSAGSAGEVNICENAEELALVCEDLTVKTNGGDFTLKRVYAVAREEWRLSLQQSITEYSLGKTTCLVYSDELGSEHLFFPGNNAGEYIEQTSDATISKTMEAERTVYILTDGSDCTRRFINGHLISITEQSGFTVYLAYNSVFSPTGDDWIPIEGAGGNKIVQILYSPTFGEQPRQMLSLIYREDGELAGFQCGEEELRYEYTYSGGKILLVGVKSSFGQKASYQYNSQGRLNRAVDGSGEFGIGITYTDEENVSRVFSYKVQGGSEVPILGDIYNFSSDREKD